MASERVERLRINAGMLAFLRGTQNRTTRDDAEWVAVSDILRAIDKEIRRWDDPHDYDVLLALRRLRARFQEADDDE